jgi:hypothetical protein
MSLLSSYSIVIAKPDDLPSAEAMSRLRMWLDTRKIEITGFKVSSIGGIGFEMPFKNECDASAFSAEFAWHLPPA